MLQPLREAGHAPVPVTLPGQGDGTAATLDQQLDAVLAAVDAAQPRALVVGHSGHCTLAWLAAAAPSAGEGRLGRHDRWNAVGRG